VAKSSPRRIGVMGGTFDPIHHGHLVAASEVQAWFDLDEVVFVPTGQPWQKSGREVSPAEDRYLMTVIATASNPRFWVSRVDIDRQGPTYTIDTLRDLRTELPGAELYFITGADALGDIFTWRDADELFRLAHFVGCTRPGYEMEESTLEGSLRTGSRSWRSRPWRSRPPNAASARRPASRCGTSCPTASSSTSPSTPSTRQRNQRRS
jgi:nicotinate-nucleotide adenylyltransferase